MDLLSTTTVAVIGATVLAVVLNIGRVQRKAGEGNHGIAVVLVALGTVVADACRFFADPPQHVIATVGAATAVLGWALMVRAVHRSWRQILCDMLLLVTTPLAIVMIVALVVAPVPDTLAQNLDVLCLLTALYATVLSLRIARAGAPLTTGETLLMGASGVVRCLAWGGAVLTTSDLVTVPYAVLLGLALISGVLGVTAAVGQSRRAPASTVHPEDHGDGRAVVVLTSLAALLFVVTLPGWPTVGRPSIATFAALVVGSLVLRLTLSIRDLTAATALVQEREAYFRTLVQDSQDVIMIATREGALTYLSPAAEPVLGIPPDTPDQRVWDVIGVPAEDVLEAFRRCDEDRAVRLDGRRGAQVIEATVTARGDDVVVSARDVTERDQLRQRLHRMAYHDALTDLPNRAQLLDHVDGLLARSTHNPPVALTFIDLDRFKHVNDASGHQAGDEVLREAAARLTAQAGGAFLARLGGDEFVLVSVVERQHAAQLAEMITTALSEPFLVSGVAYRIGASAGIAFSNRDSTAAELLRCADIAMYRAKRQRQGWAIYDHSMSEALTARVGVEGEAAAALQDRALMLYLQPIVRIAPLEVVSCEGLLRWRGPDGTMRGPLALLEYAAHSHQLGTLTGWVIEAAVRRIAGEPHHVGIAVNIPPTVLVDPSLVDTALAALERYDVNPRRLTLEITEEAMLAQSERSLKAIGRLRAAHMRVVLDDFGTGYSSLSYLTRFPVDGVKVDRGFTAELGTSRAARSIVRGLVGVTRELGMRLVAEGVETADQHRWLGELEVPFAQGYWYARPEPADGLRALDALDAWVSAPADDTPPAAIAAG